MPDTQALVSAPPPRVLHTPGGHRLPLALPGPGAHSLPLSLGSLSCLAGTEERLPTSLSRRRPPRAAAHSPTYRTTSGRRLVRGEDGEAATQDTARAAAPPSAPLAQVPAASASTPGLGSGPQSRPFASGGQFSTGRGRGFLSAHSLTHLRATSGTDAPDRSQRWAMRARPVSPSGHTVLLPKDCHPCTPSKVPETSASHCLSFGGDLCPGTRGKQASWRRTPRKRDEHSDEVRAPCSQ